MGSGWRIGWLSVQRGKGGELGLEVAEVVRVGGMLAQLVNDGEEVMHGAHGLERLRVCGAKEAPAGGEGEGGLDEG